MGAQVVDYRVSTLVVLCKDCGQDVGLYPSRHKCQTNISRPPVPALPGCFTESSESLQVHRKPVQSPETTAGGGSSYPRPTSAASSTSFSSSLSPNLSDTTSTTTASSSPASGKWSRFGQRSIQQEDEQQEGNDSIYFNKFAAHLPDEEPQGRKLWGKVRHNEKWKQMTEKNDTPKPTGKLWGKLLLATQNIADKIPSRDDKGPESDESDWEGETHVSRALREYYEKKRRPLPHWLRDERTPLTSAKHHHQQNHDTRTLEVSAPKGETETSSRRRLWDHSEQTSNRERERRELRQQPSAKAPKMNNMHQQQPYGQNYNDNHDHYYDESSSYRKQDHRQGYDSRDQGNYDYQSGYNDQYQPVSYRSNARTSQGDPRVEQHRRPHMREASPSGYDDKQARGGYRSDIDINYYAGRQPPSSHDRLQGPRQPPNRPNRYLSDTKNADYF